VELRVVRPLEAHLGEADVERRILVPLREGLDP
jgi:hypothetical protein